MKLKQESNKIVLAVDVIEIAHSMFGVRVNDTQGRAARHILFLQVLEVLFVEMRNFQVLSLLRLYVRNARWQDPILL